MTPGTIALAAILLLGPGLPLTFALFKPGRMSLATRLGLAAPLGYATSAIVALLLTLGGVLYLPLFVAGWAVVTIIAVVAGVRRFGVRPHWEAIHDEVRSDRWLLLVALIALAVLAVPRLSYDPVLNLSDQTPLRYWADGVEIADARRIPETSIQWGVEAPTSESKVALNAFDASASLVLGRGPLPPMGALLVVVSVALLLVGYALGRELGLRYLAPLVPLLLFANHLLGPRDLTLDLDTYKAENWGRLAAFAAMVLAVRAVRARRIRSRSAEAVVGGVLLGVAAATHLVPTAVAVAFVLAYGIAWWVATGHLRTPSFGVATVLGVGVVLGVALLLAAGGEIGLGGGVDREAYDQIAANLGQPAGWDPTRYLALGELDQAPVAMGFYDPVLTTYHEFVRRAVGESVLRRPVRLLFPVAVAGALVLLLFFSDVRLRVMAIAAVALLVLVLVVGLAFSYLFDVYVMAEFGTRRLFDYGGLPVVLLVAGVLEVGVNRLLPKLTSAEVARPVVAGALVLGTVALAAPRTFAPRDAEAYFATGVPPLEWIESNIACPGRVLADRRTLATFEMFTRHAGVIEGMGPYLRPDLLETAIRSLFDAQAFFDDPAGNLSYLTQQGVAAVVVTTYGQTLGGVGGPLKLEVSRAALDALPNLRVATESRTVTVYRVVGLLTVSSGFPDVEDAPGYLCGAPAPVSPLPTGSSTTTSAAGVATKGSTVA